MKTSFTHDEIRDFIMPLLHQLQGDAMLFGVMQPTDMKNIKPEDIYDIGRFSGSIDGKFELMRKITVLFELNDEIGERK